MKFLKYKFAAFFSHHLGGALPACPFDVPDHPSDLLGSTGGRFIRRVMRSPEAFEFALGILYIKKAMPRADEADLKKACLDTKKILTTLHPVPVSKVPYRDRVVQLLDVKEQVRRTCVEICRATPGKVKPRIDEKVLHKPQAPSIKANYTSSRARLGTFGDLRKDGYLGVDQYDADEVEEDGSILADPSRGVLEYADAVEIESECKESGGGGSGEEESRVCESEFVPLVISKRWRAGFQTWYDTVYERVRAEEKEQKFDVKLVALAEALKIRVISKGPAYKYFLLKPVQKFLSRLLGRFEMFRLTRQTVTAEFLTEKFSECEGLFHSLDYKSATDLLNPSLSLEAVDSLAQELDMPPDIHEAFRMALTGHTIDGVIQQWGQLMGSVVSFVILCIVNAAVIRFSFELSSGRRVSLRECPAVVNGDDGLVRAPLSFLSIWEDVAAVAGLQPSAGKVYTHPTYANINSTSFEFRNGGFHLLPYVNMGLVFGMQRASPVSSLAEVALDTLDPRATSIGSRHHALINSCPAHLQEAVHRVFLQKNRPVLDLLQEIPWYVPESCGGVGLKVIEKVEFTPNPMDPSTPDLSLMKVTQLYGPTDVELRAMTWLLDHPSSRFVRRLPTEAPIQVRSVWTKLLPYKNSPHNPRATAYEMSEDDIGLMDVSTYYTVPSLVASQIANPSLTILKSNRSAWRKLRARFSRCVRP